VRYILYILARTTPPKIACSMTREKLKGAHCAFNRQLESRRFPTFRYCVSAFIFIMHRTKKERSVLLFSEAHSEKVKGRERKKKQNQTKKNRENKLSCCSHTVLHSFSALKKSVTSYTLSREPHHLKLRFQLHD
jgi:hypothetical protein